MNTTHTKKRYELILAVLFMFFATQAWGETFDNTKKKEIDQTFNIGASDRLQVDNRYGNITITHWNKNEIRIQVVVESKAKNDAEAQRGLDRVEIDLDKSGNIVYATTSRKNQSGAVSSSNCCIRFRPCAIS